MPDHRPFHIAQINVSTLQAPIDSPQLADFVANLDPINAIADTTPGFVWRLQTEDGDATAIRVFDDERIIVNMSVWESIEAMGEFVFRSSHTGVMRRRREWFHRAAEAYVCLWWIPAGHIPTVDEAVERLEHLRRVGPSPRAFTFRERFDPGTDQAVEQRQDEGWACPAG